MTDTHETIADIIAKMRDEGNTGESSCLEWVGAKMRDYADRLEAAHKREAVTDCNQLREALDEIRVAAMSDYEWDADYLIEKCNAALAAPPRNCDKVKTSWDVLKEWHEGLDTANDIVRMLDWLFAPATEKEGGAK